MKTSKSVGRLATKDGGREKKKMSDLRQTEEFLRALGEGVKLLLKEVSPNMGFALLVFEFDKPGLANYLSTGERPDMIKALKETVKRLEAHEDIPATIGGMQ